MSLPVIDLSESMASTAAAIERACRDSGFFYVAGHGVPRGVIARLDAAAREFFALPDADKMEIAMEHGGRAWRGFFPVGAELTSGRPGPQGGHLLRCRTGPKTPVAGLPLHGRNLFPRQVPELREAVLDYLDRADRDRAGGAARRWRVSLGLDAGLLRRRLHAPTRRCCSGSSTTRRRRRSSRTTGASASTPTTAC